MREPIARASRRASTAPVKVESGGSAVTARQAGQAGQGRATYKPSEAEKAPAAFFGGRLFAFAAGFGLGTLCFAMPSFAGTKLLHTEVTKNVKGIGADIEQSNTELRQRVARLEHQIANLESRQ
jgi:hypothetical protein